MKWERVWETKKDFTAASLMVPSMGALVVITGIFFEVYNGAGT